MDDKHKKAKKVYAEYQQEDPDEGVYCMVVREIKDAVIEGLVLNEVVESISQRFYNDEPKRAVSVLEAIYEALKNEAFTNGGNVQVEEGKTWNAQRDIEVLFNHAVKVMYDAAKDRFKDTTNLLQECYPDLFQESTLSGESCVHE